MDLQIDLVAAGAAAADVAAEEEEEEEEDEEVQQQQQQQKWHNGRSGDNSRLLTSVLGAGVATAQNPRHCRYLRWCQNY